MSARRHRFHGISLAAAIVLASAPAPADVTKDQCIDANRKAQELRRDGKLSAAGEQLRSCANASCPPMVRDDCTKRLDDLERAQPTIIFEAKDGAGNDLSSVRVTVDGLPLAERLAGTPLSIDPGEHTFTFEAAGQPTLQRKLVIRESEKDRRERIILGPSPPCPPGYGRRADGSCVDVSEKLPLRETPHPPPSVLGTQKILAIVAAGAGVAGLGLGSAFGLMAMSKKNDAQNACPTSPCAKQDGSNKWSDAASTGNISTVAFIIGGVVLAGAAVLWFTAPSSSNGASTQVGIGPGVLQLKGTW